MNLLILGGTSFLGRHLTETALKRGYAVTLFNRGVTNPSLFPQVRQVMGARDGGVQALAGGGWDAVVDTSGYIPRVVRQGLSILSGQVGRYIFISSLSVHSDYSAPGVDESSPTIVLDDPQIEEITGDTYGGLKALCEQAVLEVFPEKAMIVRPGLIVGPCDPSDRFTYWPHRISRGGEVLAPDRPGRLIQFVDVRDIAAWILLAVENRMKGTYNATGPAEPLPMGRFLETCRTLINPEAELVWVEDAFLQENDVSPWSDLPLWIPESEPDFSGFMQCNCGNAIDQGLRFRPLSESVMDTQRWNSTRPQAREWKAGLSVERERKILELWKRGP